MKCVGWDGASRPKSSRRSAPSRQCRPRALQRRALPAGPVLEAAVHGRGASHLALRVVWGVQGAHAGIPPSRRAIRVAIVAAGIPCGTLAVTAAPLLALTNRRVLHAERSVSARRLRLRGSSRKYRAGAAGPPGVRCRIIATLADRTAPRTALAALGQRRDGGMRPHQFDLGLRCTGGQNQGGRRTQGKLAESTCDHVEPPWSLSGIDLPTTTLSSRWIL